MEQKPLTKQQIRAGGVVVVTIGLAVLLGNWLNWKINGKVILVLFAIPLVFIPGGIYMIVTGKIPNQKKS